MGIFRSILQGFLPFSPVSLTELCSFWYGLKDLFTLHKLAEKLFLTIKTDDVTSGRREVDPHGRLRGSSGANGLNYSLRQLHFFIFHSLPLHAPVGVLIIVSFFPVSTKSQLMTEMKHF